MRKTLPNHVRDLRNDNAKTSFLSVAHAQCKFEIFKDGVQSGSFEFTDSSKKKRFFCADISTHI